MLQYSRQYDIFNAVMGEIVKYWSCLSWPIRMISHSTWEAKRTTVEMPTQLWSEYTLGMFCVLWLSNTAQSPKIDRIKARSSIPACSSFHGVLFCPQVRGTRYTTAATEVSKKYKTGEMFYHVLSSITKEVWLIVVGKSPTKHMWYKKSGERKRERILWKCKTMWLYFISLTITVQRHQTGHHKNRVPVELFAGAIPRKATTPYSVPIGDKHHT